MQHQKISNPAGWILAISVAVISTLPLNFLLAPISPESSARELNLFHQVRENINKEYYKKVKSEDLLYNAINGMVEKLDKNCRFFQPKEAKNFEELNTGEFGGLGIHIEIDEGKLLVKAPMLGSPALKAGIRAGDIITHVDGKKLPPDMTNAKASDYLKGPRFSKVTISVERWRTGEKADLVVTRDIIQVPSINNVHMLPARINQPSIAYLRLYQFQQSSEVKFLEQIGELVDKEGKFDSIILDFRNNPGGDLGVATSIIDFFIAKENLVMLNQSERSGDKPTKTTSEAPLNGIPVCVLLNRNSASASELVAGALRDYKIALLVGERSHGKGSVQTLYNFQGYKEILKLTTAIYYTPNNHTPDRDTICRHDGLCFHKSNQDEIKRGGLRPDLETPLAGFEAPIGDLLGFAATISLPSFCQAHVKLLQRRTANFLDMELAAAAGVLASPERFRTLMDSHD